MKQQINLKVTNKKIKKYFIKIGHSLPNLRKAIYNYAID